MNSTLNIPEQTANMFTYSTNPENKKKITLSLYIHIKMYIYVNTYIYMYFI